MRLCIYRGFDDERVPKDTTHAIVDENVTIIKEYAFNWCEILASIIMGDNVKTIDEFAFYNCHALRFIRLSKTLDFVGEQAFSHCQSLEALFLPSTVKFVESDAFALCRSLRLIILPNTIDLDNVDRDIIDTTTIEQIVENDGLEIEDDDRVNDWLIHHMDYAPLHKHCYSSSINAKKINDYLNEHGNESTLQIDTIHRMTPLQMLSMNPHAPADSIASLLDSNIRAAFCLDSQQKTPLDSSRDYNVGGLIAMINGLFNCESFL